jgi:hypothetical protein
MLVLRMDQSSHSRLHPQQIEIVAGDCIAGDIPDGITPAQSRLTVSIEAPDIAKGGISLLDVPERGIRCRQRLPTSPRTDAKLVEILRVAHFQRVQQDRIHDSEDDDFAPIPSIRVTKATSVNAGDFQSTRSA